MFHNQEEKHRMMHRTKGMAAIAALTLLLAAAPAIADEGEETET